MPLHGQTFTNIVYTVVLSSLSSYDECRLSARWSPTVRPSHPMWAVSLPVGCYYLCQLSPFIIITQSEG